MLFLVLIFEYANQILFFPLFCFFPRSFDKYTCRDIYSLFSHYHLNPIVQSIELQLYECLYFIQRRTIDCVFYYYVALSFEANKRPDGRRPNRQTYIHTFTILCLMPFCVMMVSRKMRTRKEGISYYTELMWEKQRERESAREGKEKKERRKKKGIILTLTWLQLKPPPPPS